MERCKQLAIELHSRPQNCHHPITDGPPKDMVVLTRLQALYKDAVVRELPPGEICGASYPRMIANRLEAENWIPHVTRKRIRPAKNE